MEAAFHVYDVDWSRLPQLKDLAVEQFAIPNGHHTKHDVSSPKTAVDTAAPVEITSAPDSQRMHGGVRGDVAVARSPPEDQRKQINS